MPLNRRTAIRQMLAGAASLPFARSVGALPPIRVRAKRMLFLGGTGFLGPHMVRRAIEQGYHITLFTRGRAGLELFPDAERLTGDRASDLSALKGKTWDVVIDNSGYVPADVRASATLLRDSVGHYVYTSTIDAYRDFREPNITEDYPLARLPEGAPHNPGRYYGALKALCEAEARAAFPGRCTIIRPGWVVGPGDTNHSLHVLGDAHSPGRRVHCARYANGSCPDGRCHRSRGVRHPHGRRARCRRVHRGSSSDGLR